MIIYEVDPSGVEPPWVSNQYGSIMGMEGIRREIYPLVDTAKAVRIILLSLAASNDCTRV